TLAGVLLAFSLPFAHGDEGSPSYKVQHCLHKPVAFIIMPLFALANTGFILSGNWLKSLTTSNSLGILVGLLLGKPLGIVLFTLAAVKLRISHFPPDVSLRNIFGRGFFGGIGFSMSIFIALLAFSNPDIIQSAKMSILLSSLLAGATGFVML